MDDKTDYRWNECNSFYTFYTESARAFICCPRLDFVFENC